MHLFVVGAGHVGLVSATGFRALGHRVTVADVQADRIERLRQGIPPIYEPGLEDAIRAGLADGSLASVRRTMLAISSGTSGRIVRTSGGAVTWRSFIVSFAEPRNGGFPVSISNITRPSE